MMIFNAKAGLRKSDAFASISTKKSNKCVRKTGTNYDLLILRFRWSNIYDCVYKSGRRSIKKAHNIIPN